jgi:hypothetical protein
MIYEEGWHLNTKYPYLWDPLLSSSPPPSDNVPYMSVNAIYFDCHVGKVSLPRLTQYANCYDGCWYWYDGAGNQIPQSAGMTQGWDLAAGVHDRQ